MNRFRLPYHLVVEDGIFNNVPDCMKDVFPVRGSFIQLDIPGSKQLADGAFRQVGKQLPDIAVQPDSGGIR